MTEITQADRDAARAYYEEWMEDWTGDDYPAAMFARHRLEERAKIVAWLRVFWDGEDDEDFKLAANLIEQGKHLK